MTIAARRAAMTAVLLLLLASRRWDQLLWPQVWDEDGPRNIHDFVVNGLASLFYPVNGYLITVPKLISALALSISFSRYPMVSTVFAWAFIAFVGMAVASSPTKLRGRWWCAVAIFLVPTDPEVFGLPLYTFWWSSLLLFLLALWDEQRSSIGWRIAFLLLGGLSSPVILLVVPVLYWRAWAYRAWRAEWIIACVATVIALIQAGFILKGAESRLPPLGSILMNTGPVFLGRFVVGNWVESPIGLALAGLCVACWLALCAWQLRREAAFWICVYLFVGAIGLSVIRIDPAVLHPIRGGARYLFFPFVLISWLLVQGIYAARFTWVRALAAGIGTVAVMNAFPAWSHSHDDLHWTEHAVSCRRFATYEMPVQFVGLRESSWRLPLSGEDCARLLDRDLLLTRSELESRPTFPYATYTLSAPNGTEGAALVGGTMAGSDFTRSRIPGFVVVGSYEASDADVGTVDVRLHRGDSLRYRSGPAGHGQTLTILDHEKEFVRDLPLANDWVTLVFSNSTLPAEFVVRIADEGRAWGEWSAIAVPQASR